jgi:hypothetical protein
MTRSGRAGILSLPIDDSQIERRITRLRPIEPSSIRQCRTRIPLKTLKFSWNHQTGFTLVSTQQPWPRVALVEAARSLCRGLDTGIGFHFSTPLFCGLATNEHARTDPHQGRAAASFQ